MPDKMETMEERAKQFQLGSYPAKNVGDTHFAIEDREQMVAFARSEVKRFAEAVEKELCADSTLTYMQCLVIIRKHASRYTNGGG